MRVWKRLTAAMLLLSICGCARATGIDQGPYLMKPTQTGITVCWVSESPTTGAVTVLNSGKTVSDTRETRFHRVALTGLKPYTHYTFSVACAGVTKSGGFMTAAPPNQPFRFVAYGDNRTQPKVHAAVLARMGLFKPDFIVQTGDQVADGNNQGQWDEFWRIAGSALSETAYYPSLGNHERHGAPYFEYFAVPQDYAFDYGNAHFVALDSNRPPSEYAAQQEWLRKDLAAHQSAKWRIVFFHHTMHTCVDMPERRAESAARAKRLEPLLVEGHVQMVINGHDHDYQHHLAQGITYLVTGGGGAPLYDVTPDTPFVLRAKKAHHHCEIQVKRDALSVRVVEPDGDVIEDFTIQAGGVHP
jgi:hypothetical protein